MQEIHLHWLKLQGVWIAFVLPYNLAYLDWEEIAQWGEFCCSLTWELIDLLLRSRLLPSKVWLFVRKLTPDSRCCRVMRLSGHDLWSLGNSHVARRQAEVACKAWRAILPFTRVSSPRLSSRNFLKLLLAFLKGRGIKRTKS